MTLTDQITVRERSSLGSEYFWIYANPPTALEHSICRDRARDLKSKRDLKRKRDILENIRYSWDPPVLSFGIVLYTNILLSDISYLYNVAVCMYISIVFFKNNFYKVFAIAKNNILSNWVYYSIIKLSLIIKFIY